jgi:hypothetical protein
MLHGMTSVNRTLHRPASISLLAGTGVTDCPDAGIGQDRAEVLRELPGAVADQEAEVPGAVTGVRQERLRICWVVHGPSGCAVIPGICRQPLPSSTTSRQYKRRCARRCCERTAWPPPDDPA